MRNRGAKRVKLRSVARWSRGRRERVAYSVQRLVDAKVIVFREHLLILIMFLPILLPRLGEGHSHVGFSAFFRLRRLGRRYDLFHSRAQIRQPARSQHRLEYSNGHLDHRRLSHLGDRLAPFFIDGNGRSNRADGGSGNLCQPLISNGARAIAG